MEWIVNKQKVICNDCLDEMRGMPDQIIDIVVTSPPYNLNIKYNKYEDDLKHEEYLQWMHNITVEIERILKPKGSLFINMGSSCKNPFLAMDVCQTIRNTGLVLQNNIVWVKSITIGNRSHGHFKPVPGKRFLNNQHESIYHFTKQGNVEVNRLSVGVPYADKSNLGRWEHVKADMRCAGNVWFIPYKTVQKKKQHPAGFPVGLPERCIKLHGFNEDTVVLDPFLGSGTTLEACQKLGVNGIGIELDEEYCKITMENLKETYGTT